MYAFTQTSYDCIMDYIGLNQRSKSLLCVTKYTGFVRWHERNHEVYDEINSKIIKYIGNMYCEHAAPKMVSTYNYTISGGIMAHIEAWKTSLEPMRMSTYAMYEEACSIGDFCLAHEFKCMNQIVNNELLQLKRLMRRLKGSDESDLMFVNKEIHDYFEENENCKHIDLSL